jgi:CelD/BcsL family acetyltransferase involved in cellulose biosynthesis
VTTTVTVTWIECDSDFDQLEVEWDRLFKASGHSSPFLTWPWVRTWWKSFRKGSRLFILTCRDGDQKLIGIAPLLIASRKSFGILNVRVVEFLGNRGSTVGIDHLDFITLTDDRESILQELVKTLINCRTEWDALAMSSFMDTSLVPGLLRDALASEASNIMDGDEEVCPWISLPSTWDQFVETMKREHKSLISNLRRKRNRLNAEHTVEFFAGPAVGDPLLHVETLAELHRLARMRQGGEGSFGLSEYRQFHDNVVQAMQANNSLYLARLDIDGKPAAAWYGFLVSSVLSYYQSGFDTKYVKEGVGDVLLGMILEDAITRLGADGFDFLRGTEEYKFRWTHEIHIDRTVLYWSKTVSGRIAKKEFLWRRQASRWKQEFYERKAAWKRAKILSSQTKDSSTEA